VYRKGIDLLVSTIPSICDKYPYVDFIIAGDGPKRIDVEQMRERFVLQDRVQVLGSVAHRDIRNILVRGDIFLNTSLTEAFCISIVEAASCGLLVVSTKVGGVPEVLPDEMIIYADPSKDSIMDALEKAFETLPSVNPELFHKRLTTMYSWSDIAERTEVVYSRVLASESKTLAQRLSRYNNCGPYAGKIAALVMTIDYLLYLLLEW
jgi:phosphatidylinositol N-acetylglucosaminyltransferase subunit A